MKKRTFCKKMHMKSIAFLLTLMMLLLCPLQAYASEVTETPGTTETPGVTETPETPETPEEPEEPVLPKYPSKIKLNKTKAENYYGCSISLKATITPTEVQNKKVTWSSSNKKVATVSSTGKVKITGNGTATITAKTANGKKATCKVTGYMYKLTSDKKYIKIGSKSGKTTKYRLYKQYDYAGSYYGNFGCVTTSVSTALSGLGKNYSPMAIHTGSSSSKHSELYAVKKMGASTSLWGKAAISVRTASQIIKDVGVTNKARYTFDVKAAEKEIRAHLEKGKPVIIKANNKNYGGVKIANGHHALTVIGIDANGYLTFIDPATAKINFAHGNGTYANKMTLSRLLTYHMSQPTGNTAYPYVLNEYTAGGYILVGK